MTYIQSDNPSMIFVIDAVCLLAANITAAFVFEQINKNNNIKTEYRLLNLKTQNTKAHIEELESMVKEQRRATHEFKNHLLAINGFCDGGNYDGLKEYLIKLNSDISKHETLLLI